MSCKGYNGETEKEETPNADEEMTASEAKTNKTNKTEETEETEEIKNYGAEDFLRDLDLTSKAYLIIVAATGFLALCAIVMGVTAKVSYGVAAAVIVAVAYVGAVDKLLYSHLGLGYKTSSGELTVTAVYGKGRNAAFIPRRLLMVRVTKIGERAFEHKSSCNITAVYLPKTIKTVEKDAFEGAPLLSAIYYEGSREDWERVDKRCSFGGTEVVFDGVIPYPVKEKRRKNKNKEAVENAKGEKK